MADAKFEPKLPKTFAKSLQLKPHEPSVLVKARTHEKKAEALRQDAKDAVREAHREAQKNPRQPAPEPDAPRPHLEYLERFKALEITVAPIEARAKHEWANKLGEEPKPHQVIGHVIASLPRPRMDALFRDPRLAELNV